MEKRKKFLQSLLLVFLVLTGVFLLVQPAAAGIIEDAVSYIFQVFASFFALFVGILIDLIVHFAQYNNFLKTRVVIEGWRILRDLCNMFFILILLVIAFSTTLKIENYSYKRLLAPLLIMAVLVNFSMTICGLIIDFSQVIMLTFVNAFKDVGAANLTQMLGLSESVSVSGKYAEVKETTGVDGWNKVWAWLLAAVMMFVAVVVTAIILVILIARIVLLWVLIILSPLAFVMRVLPGTQKYAQQWQDKFVKQVIVGPVLAFFLWLAFYAVQVGNIKKETIGSAMGLPGLETSKYSVGASQLGQVNVIASFAMGVGLLLAALWAAQQLSVAGASLAGKGMAFLQKAGTKVGTAGIKGVSGIPGRLTSALLRSKRFEKSKLGQTEAGKFFTQWAKDSYDARRAKKERKRLSFLKKIGMGESTMFQLDNILLRITTKKGVPRTGMMGFITDKIIGTTQRAAHRGAVEERTGKAGAAKLNDPLTADAEAASMTTKPEYLYNSYSGLSRGMYLRLRNMNSTGMAALAKAIADPSKSPNDKTLLVENLKNALAAILVKDGQFSSPTYEFDINNALQAAFSGSIPGGPIDMADLQQRKASVQTNFDPMWDADSLKQQRTKEAKEKFEANPDNKGKDFFESDDYQKNKEQYYSREEYIENESFRKWVKNPENRGGLSINSFARGQSREIAIDFDKLGLDYLRGVAGVHLGSELNREQINQVRARIQDLLSEKIDNLSSKKDKTKGDEIRINYLKSALEKFKDPEEIKNLIMYNTARTGIGIRRLRTHEYAHQALSYLDPEEKVQKDIWEKMHTPEEREQIKQQLEKKRGRSLNDEEVRREYFAEGLTNNTRYADRSPDAIKLKEGVAEKLDVEIGAIIKEGRIERVERPVKVEKELVEKYKSGKEVPPEVMIQVTQSPEVQNILKNINLGLTSKDFQGLKSSIDNFILVLQEKLKNFGYTETLYFKGIKNLNEKFVDLSKSLQIAQNMPNSVESIAVLEQVKDFFDQLKS